MGKIITIDGHNFTERKDGLYQVDKSYEITSDWMDAKEHINMAVITRIVEEKRYVEILSVSAKSVEEISLVNKVAADMRKDGSTILVMWAETDDKNSILIGGLERVED